MLASGMKTNSMVWGCSLGAMAVDIAVALIKEITSMGKVWFSKSLTSEFAWPNGIWTRVRVKFTGLMDLFTKDKWIKMETGRAKALLETARVISYKQDGKLMSWKITEI
jgi:hypothetical protein